MSDVNAMVERAAERIERGNYAADDHHGICVAQARAVLLAALDPEDEVLVEAFALMEQGPDYIPSYQWAEMRAAAKANPHLYNHWRFETDRARKRIEWLRSQCAQGGRT